MQGVGPPEQARRAGKIAAGQMLAYRGTADPLAIQQQRRHGFHPKTCRAVDGLQIFHIAQALVPEAKIRPHHQLTHTQALDQQMLDEGVARHSSQPGIEMQAQHAVHAQRLQGGQLLAQAHQARLDRIGPEELQRLRLEQHHPRRQAGGGGVFLQARNDGLVAQMHAVEIADAGHAAAMLRAQVVQAADQFHAGIHIIVSGSGLDCLASVSSAPSRGPALPAPRPAAGGQRSPRRSRGSGPASVPDTSSTGSRRRCRNRPATGPSPPGPGGASC